MAGLVGALIGFALGLLEYRVISGAVVAALRRTDRSQSDEERADYARRIRILQAVLLLMTVGAMPVVGFFVGRALFG
ncbi:hypothetical protein ASG72_13790 [Bosea sp. Leaf344]|jgi:hypothetical protein|uniref:hypothetical protein n=1 Tax=Bosea sp. Leaf344 TaxID=1736346 RepID=UPI0006F6852E|nr:hypothetical protein [Bosea sp. Leaf344]KQU50896.1 hypothetical protein ASG72_13790 [Bosea sp. Leaf344]